MGLLGARLERDAATKFFRVAKIFKGQNWDPALRSPLTEIGVNVKEGDFIVAVDGRSTAELTRHLGGAGRQGGQAGDAEGERRRGGPGRARRGRDSDGGRAQPLLLQLGAGEHRQGHARRPAAASATSTSPTWACPA